jgi:hypothetical protein
MGIETSVILQYFSHDLVRIACGCMRSGRLTGRGAGGAWKAFGTRKRVGIVRSIFRQSRAIRRRPAFFQFRKVNRTGVQHPFEMGRHRKVWGSRPRLSANSPHCVGARESCSTSSWGDAPSALLTGRGPICLSHSVRCDVSHFGKCNKDRLVPSLRCKRSPFGQEVQFLPLPTNIATNIAAKISNTRIWSIGWAQMRRWSRHSGDGGSIPSIRTNPAAPTNAAPPSLRKLIW